ncbi:MAG: helix-turn-helix domain-containing protein [Parvularculaceae bacterium]
MARNSERKTSPSGGRRRRKSARSDKTQSKDPSPFLSIDEAALYLRVTARALEHYRCDGGGPAYRKHGGSIVYHIHDLDRWSAQRRYSSTAQKAEQ